jgi:hypothetical protein
MPENPNFDERLMAYLDGIMQPEERVAFEEELSRNPEQQKQIQLQQQIDESLQRQFAVPASVPNIDFATLDESAVQVASRMTTKSPIWKWFWAAAALIVWALIYGAFIRRPDPTIQFVQRPAEEIYKECVNSGFRPYWDCNGQDDRFAATFEQRVGTPLRLKQLPTDLRMAGISYLQAISRNTTAMLTYVEDQPVIVFVDERSKDRGLEQPTAESGLKLFRKELDELVIYELTPLDEPRFLNTLQRR